MNSNFTRSVQIKICGLTREDEALECAKLGADAIGLVFFPKSPRNVVGDRARAISEAVAGHAKTVGVFVNAGFHDILHKATHCGLSAVQLHGQEPPELVRRLSEEGIRVVKALFDGGSPPLSDVDRYQASAFLVECSKGPLPGGNAMEWDWGSVRDFGIRHPLVLAGGLSPENVTEALSASLPSAVDVSSGVETSPGRKDLLKVSRFIQEVEGWCSRAPVSPRGPIFS